MAMAMARCGLRAALRGGNRSAPPKRSFASSASHDDAYEAAKWEKITYLGIVTCTVLAIYNLSKGHPHFEDSPPYPYLHIRNKEFPWGLQENHIADAMTPFWTPFYFGPDGLFENKEHH